MRGGRVGVRRVAESSSSAGGCSEGRGGASAREEETAVSFTGISKLGQKGNALVVTVRTGEARRVVVVVRTRQTTRGVIAAVEAVASRQARRSMGSSSSVSVRQTGAGRVVRSSSSGVVRGGSRDVRAGVRGGVET